MPVNIMLEFVQQLMEQNAALLKQNDELTVNVKELREQLNKISKNSSKPPSSDGLRNRRLSQWYWFYR